MGNGDGERLRYIGEAVLRISRKVKMREEVMLCKFRWLR